LSNNSCDYGLSCQAKSQCVQSIETTCNCSVVLRCKTSHESGLKKSETEIGKCHLNLLWDTNSLWLRAAVISTWLRTKTKGYVGSIPGFPCQHFFNPKLQKKTKALSVRVIVICSGHILLWRDSYRCADHSLTCSSLYLTRLLLLLYQF